MKSFYVHIGEKHHKGILEDLESSKLLQLSNRRDRICESFMAQQRKSSSVLSKIINTNYEPTITHSYSLRSLSSRLNNVQTIVRTNRFCQFVTNKFWTIYTVYIYIFKKLINNSWRKHKEKSKACRICICDTDSCWFT
jgi:tyrosine-protein phosphatase YwqE